LPEKFDFRAVSQFFFINSSSCLKKVFFAVTNDLSYDQRMHRICTSLSANGYDVTLVGRKLSSSLPLEKKSFHQHRLRCIFKKGKSFYAEYNARLFLFLLFKKIDAICAVDLDTILPCLSISRLKKIPRIYDAHELFTELKEVISRPQVKNIWDAVERRAVPAFTLGYTVSDGIAEEFRKRYGVQYATIRNLPVLHPLLSSPVKKYILYQGAVNEARGLEFLIPAMKDISARLVVCGDGNFMAELKKLVIENGVADKVEIRGMVKPEELQEVAAQAIIGVSFPEKEGLNQWLALPNKFFDHIQQALPQVTVNYPEYKKINDQYNVAVLVDDIKSQTISAAVNNLLANDVLLAGLRENCMRARKELNWEQEEKKLLAFYHNIPFRN
jgi:glycosyltransferase involved in cell wall biosynthesis